MSRPLSLSAACYLLLSLTALAARDDGVIITLESGARFEGRVRGEKKGRLLVDTILGRRSVPAVTVVGRSPVAPVRESYRGRQQGVAKDDVAARERLMRWCKTQGFTTGLAAELDLILRQQPDHPGAWSVIDQLAPHYRLARPNRQPRGKPRWSRREVDLQYAAAKKASFVTAAIIRTQLTTIPIRMQLNEAIEHADRGTEPQRWIAAHLLGLSDETRRVKPLYRRALGDPSRQVRHAATQSLKKHDDGTTIGPLIKALTQSRSSATRAYAAEALGRLGDKRAVPYLLNSLAGSATGSTRNHVLQTRQTAYIKDFDVEIAQAAVIADPIVDVVTEGTVLDVGVVSVAASRRVVTRSLNRLTGAGLPARVGAWKGWWASNKQSYGY